MKIVLLIIGVLLICWMAAPVAASEDEINAGLSPDFELSNADGSDVTLGDLFHATGKRLRHLPFTRDRFG